METGGIVRQKCWHVAISTVVSILACTILCIDCNHANASQQGSKYMPSQRQVLVSQKFWQGLQNKDKTVRTVGLYPKEWPNYVAFGNCNALNEELVLRKELYVDLTKLMATSGDQDLDGMVRHVIGRVTGRGSDALRKAYEFVSKYDYEYENLYPKGDWTVWSRKYAKQMYKERRGNCYRYASLMCWIARELGYDARTVSGEVMSSSMGYQAHGWCEINQGGRWYIVDPDSHKFIPSRNFFMVSIEDAPAAYRYMKA